MSIEGIRQARNAALAERAARSETFAARVTCGASDIIRSAGASSSPRGSGEGTRWLEAITQLGGIGSIRETLETACVEARHGEVSRGTLKASVGGVAEIGTRAAVLASGGLALGGAALTGGSAIAVIGATAVGFFVLPKIARAATDFTVDLIDNLAKRLGATLRERIPDLHRLE